MFLVQDTVELHNHAKKKIRQVSAFLVEQTESITDLLHDASRALLPARRANRSAELWLSQITTWEPFKCRSSGVLLLIKADEYCINVKVNWKKVVGSNASKLCFSIIKRSLSHYQLNSGSLGWFPKRDKVKLFRPTNSCVLEGPTCFSCFFWLWNREKRVIFKRKTTLSCASSAERRSPILLTCSRLSVSGDGSERSAGRATSGTRPRSSLVPRFFPIRPHWPRTWNRLDLTHVSLKMMSCC